MLFLHRHAFLFVCIILVQYHFCFLFSSDEECMIVKTKIPFKVSVEMVPCPQNLYKKSNKLFDPEQCFTKKAALWCIKKESLDQKIEPVTRCQNVVPFGMAVLSDNKKFMMRPFAKLQQQVCTGQNHYRLQDDNYDIEYGYSFLLIGNHLYNDPLPEAYRKYLAEQYYTKRSTLWCVRQSSVK